MADEHEQEYADERREDQAQPDAPKRPRRRDELGRKRRASEPASAPQSEGPASADPNAPSEDDLQSQGFTAEEVRRLVVISDRAAHSVEARAAEAEMRRLRFTQWLIEHGVLDEWSA